VAREPGPLEALARELSPRTEVLALAADVALDAERIAATALERFGAVDILVNNASTIGSSPMPRLEALSWEELGEVVRVNVLAPFHLIALLLPSMRARGRGTIVNVTSDAAVTPYPGWGAYGASKAALEQLSRILAAELEGEPIRVLLVDPGDMNTRMHQEAEPGVDLSHLPTPDRVAPFFGDVLQRPSGRYQAVVVGR
jgi:NAD(P)-dependent dehydrogenase (short-subunit alcohol dehydrogenase family)